MSAGRIVRVLGQEIEILVSSASTGNQFCIAVQTAPPGGGPPPHIQEQWSTVFSVLDGKFELFDGKNWAEIGKDTNPFRLRGQATAFRNSGNVPGRMLFTTIPGGWDTYLEELAPLSVPEDLQRIEEISKVNGITFLQPDSN